MFFLIIQAFTEKNIKKGGAKNHSPLLPTRQTTKIVAI